ncbi:MAG: hypothetical protein R3326_01640 [Gemmatimonadota bacterium]|nr:hypothetical protein [Gemmatimonadota bacterium]
MRFTKLIPVFAFVFALGLGACAEQGAEEGEAELTPADTAMTTPPPAPAEEPMMEEPMMEDDTMMEEGAMEEGAMEEDAMEEGDTGEM